MAVCDTCGKEYGELAKHTPAEDDGDCTTAITCSVCGTVTAEAKTSHEDNDADSKCDVCEKEMSAPPTDDPTTDPNTGNTENPTDDNNGISIGVIIAIVIGSVAVIGCLVWFVIKNKQSNNT